MPVSRGARADTPCEITEAVLCVSDRGGLAVFASAGGGVRLMAEPGILWAEVIPTQRGARSLRAIEKRLETLGWRPPADHTPHWFQYFHPNRKRHHRALAEHLLDTLHGGLRSRGPIATSVVVGATADGPTFVLDDEDEAASGQELLDTVARILSHFEPEQHGGHLEFAVRRKRHTVRFAVTAREGALSVAALHLPAVTAENLESALAVSDSLDRVPYSYGVRTVAGHGDSLVLLSKFAVMPEARMPHVLGMLLYTTIEPLIASHKTLHSQVESARG
jgi:hypothetical protein